MGLVGRVSDESRRYGRDPGTMPDKTLRTRQTVMSIHGSGKEYQSC